jgi:hypothetical protein
MQPRSDHAVRRTDDLQSYFTQIVNPTISEFEAEPTSIRRAFLACVVTFHAIDYLKAKAQLGQFRKDSRAFAIVDRVAHAIKHVKTRHSNQPLEAKDVIHRPPGFSDVGYFDISRFDDLVGGVTLDNEREVDLLTIVKEAAEFLRRRGSESQEVQNARAKNR